MDILFSILRAVIMTGFIVAAIVALAALFMIVFGFATSFDRDNQG